MGGILRFGRLIGLCVAAACGNVSTTPDAPMPDAAMPDAQEISTAVYRWVIDSETIPTSNAQAIALGLDLNGDAVVDNQFGAVLAAFTSSGFSIQAEVDTAVARGSILLLGEAVLGAGGPTAATFTMYTGANPRPAPCTGTTDVACRHHLNGLGVFDLAAASAHDPPLAGTISNGRLVAGPGHLQVSVVFLGATPIVLDLIGARVRLQTVTSGTVGPSVIAGAITQSQIDLRVYPGIQQSASAAVAADCTTMVPPDCGCLAGSTGRTYLSLFDNMPKNCVISLDEVRNSTLLRSLFAPDVNIEGQASLSFGIGVTAVKATFTP